jgi:hypothetical protein
VHFVAGVKAFCFKKLRATGTTEAEVEIDGMAVSDTNVLLVERKPVVNLKNVQELINKREVYRCAMCKSIDQHIQHCWAHWLVFVVIYFETYLDGHSGLIWMVQCGLAA